MRTKRVGTALVGLLVVVGWACLAAAGPAFVISPGNISLSRCPVGNTVVALRFRLSEDVFVTHLGVYDRAGDGLRDTWHIGIWRCGAYDGTTRTFATMTLMASGTIGPVGGEAASEDGFYYGNVGTPVSLNATTETGQIVWYIVGAWCAADSLDDLVLVRGAEVGAIVVPQSPVLYGRSAWGSVPMESQPWTENLTPLSGAYPGENYGVNFKFSIDMPNPNTPPQIQSVTIEPAQLGTPTTAVVACSDPDGDSLTVTVNWGGAGTVAEDDPMTYTYASTGVYEVTVTVDDGKGGTASSTAFAPVYDATAGFVTGGGWITANEKANFGFVCKYLKGATTPSGQLQFKDGDLNFQCTAYDWLVVDDDGTAQFAGECSINGEGSYFFIADITDEQDQFQIEVFDTGYSSGLQPLGGGQIKIHQK